MAASSLIYYAIAKHGSHAQLKQHRHAFLMAYNFAKRLKALKGLTPYPFICKTWEKEPQRFTINPNHFIAGLNNLDQSKFVGFGFMRSEKWFENAKVNAQGCADGGKPCPPKKRLQDSWNLLSTHPGSKTRSQDLEAMIQWHSTGAKTQLQGTSVISYCELQIILSYGCGTIGE